jgi:hypothetical protein
MTNKMYMRGGVYFGTAAEMMDRIEELEAKLAESEARSDILEELVMDVAADLYDNVPAHKIDQRIGDVMRQLDEEEEED